MERHKTSRLRGKRASRLRCPSRQQKGDAQQYGVGEYEQKLQVESCLNYEVTRAVVMLVSFEDREIKDVRDSDSRILWYGL